MSLKSWKKKFYPVQAYFLKKKSILAAIQHSIKKWVGLRPKNLKKHNLHLSDAIIFELLPDKSNSKDFSICEESCALCVKFLRTKSHCRACPIGKILRHPCDSCDTDPYKIFSQTDNVEPMIKLLKKAKRIEMARKNKKSLIKKK